MAFKSRADLGGKLDPAINTKGRVRGEREPSRREIRDRELLGLLRKIKPHMSESIMKAASIMKNEEASHANQLKAAVILLGAYRELVKDVYDVEEQEDEIVPVIQENNSPVFSLTVLK